MNPAKPNPLGRQAGGFLIVGSIGFLVDAGIFLALSHSGAVSLLVARMLAFIPATGVTWVLNRTAVFRSERRGQREALHEYLRYLLIQGLGIAINFAIFYMVVQAAPDATPLLALVLGSGAAMVFNFLGAKLLVFSR